MTLHRDMPARLVCLHCDRPATKVNRCATHYERYRRTRYRVVCALPMHRFNQSGFCISCKRPRIT